MLYQVWHQYFYHDVLWNILHVVSDIFYTGSDDFQTDMAVLDMLHYCVRRAEQNLPVKLNYHLEVSFSSLCSS